MTSLYIISPPAIEINSFAAQLESALSGGGVSVFQLRLKDIDDEFILSAARKLIPICRRHETAFIMNDRPDLAAECGADGVHLGDEDPSPSEARKILGNEASIGASCYDSYDRAMRMAEEGADYVAFGAFYPTTTKIPKARAGIETLKNWAEFTNVPCVAIGGITPYNCKPLIEAGADFLAVVSYIWNHPTSPKKAVEEFESVKDGARSRN